jgi:hypothetical protein
MTEPSLPPLPPQASLPPIPAQYQGSDKLLIILCHLSLFLGVGLILPLIVYLVKRQDSELVAAHAREVLNFHLSLVIYAVPCAVLACLYVGIPLLMALGAMWVICSIIAAIKASEGGFYHYPLTIRMIR